MNKTLLIFIFSIILYSCSEESKSDQDSKKDAKQEEKAETPKKQITFEGTPEEIGSQLIDHYYIHMNAKELDEVEPILHSEIVYVDAFKGKEKVLKQFQKTFENTDPNWLILKEVRFGKVSDEEMIIYTKERLSMALTMDAYNYMRIIKENGEFKIVEIDVLPDDQVAEFFN